MVSTCYPGPYDVIQTGLRDIERYREEFLERGEDFTEEYLGSLNWFSKFVAETLGNTKYLGAKRALEELTKPQ